jgi:hypothetical protein
MEKFLKIPDMRAAAAQKFLKLSPSRRRWLYFFGKNRRRRRRLSRSAYTSSYIPTNKMKNAQSLHKDFVPINGEVLPTDENNGTTFNNVEAH